MDKSQLAEFDPRQLMLLKSVFRGREELIIPQTCGIARIQSYDEKMMERLMESCTFKTASTYVMCYALGAAIGLFSASVGPVDVTQAQTQSFREVLKQMKTTTLWNARSFAKIGALFMVVECNVETVSFNRQAMKAIFKFYSDKECTQTVRS